MKKWEIEVTLWRWWTWLLVGVLFHYGEEWPNLAERHYIVKITTSTYYQLEIRQSDIWIGYRIWHQQNRCWVSEHAADVWADPFPWHLSTYAICHQRMWKESGNVHDFREILSYHYLNPLWVVVQDPWRLLTQFQETSESYFGKISNYNLMILLWLGGIRPQEEISLRHLRVWHFKIKVTRKKEKKKETAYTSSKFREKKKKMLQQGQKLAR